MIDLSYLLFFTYSLTYWL